MTLRHFDKSHVSRMTPREGRDTQHPICIDYLAAARKRRLLAKIADALTLALLFAAFYALLWLTARGMV